MIEFKKDSEIKLPLRLEVSTADVTGVGGSSLTVKFANRESTDWETLNDAEFTLDELSEGDYTLTVPASANDTIGHFRTKVSSVCADTKQYVSRDIGRQAHLGTGHRRLRIATSRIVQRACAMPAESAQPKARPALRLRRFLSRADARSIESTEQ